MELTAALAATGLTMPGLSWPGGTITFSIPRAESTWPGYGPTAEPYTGYATLSADQAEVFRRVIGLYDEVIAPRFVEVDDVAGPGQIRVAMSSAPSGAWAYYPPGSGQAAAPTHGDVWFDPTDTDFGMLAALFLHEVGHTLGLKHPRDEPNPLPLELQLLRLTVMGGSAGDFGIIAIKPDQSGAVGAQVDDIRVTAAGPMVADIAALQAIYGADPNSRSGDTTYTWDLSTPFLKAVYDAGGVDTYDLSDHTRKSLVDLTPGSYSSIGIWTSEEQEAYFRAAYPHLSWNGWFKPDNAMLYTYERNLGTAFSTVIENVLAGAGDDTLIGNDVANILNGGAGADLIQGGGGSDTIISGAGANFLRGGLGADQITGGDDFDNVNGNQGDDTVRGGAGGDWVLGGQDNDQLFGDAGADILNGNLGVDTVQGGSGEDSLRGGQGDDLLSGEDGADWLSGDRGADTLTGGAGADLFYAFAGGGADVITDFSGSAGDRVQLDRQTTYSISQRGTDVVVQIGDGGGDELILKNTDTAQFSESWVIFA